MPTDAPARNIERVALDQLHADMGNARRHDTRNLQAIKDSLRQFGQVEPLVVQGGSGKVIGGNGRLEAMRALEWQACDVVRVELTDVQAAALGIALNRTGELGQWDSKALESVLSSLEKEWELGDLGFDQDELERILQPGLDLGQPDDPADEPEHLGEGPPDDDDEAGPPSPAQPAAPPPANVRMVQLFFQPATAEEFYRLADAAQKQLGTPHLTDTVLAVLRLQAQAPSP